MQIGFLPVTIWDVIDILIVGFLIYQIYRLLRGSVAFYIFIGVVLMYLLWWLVKTLNMELLSLILGQFVSVGVISLIIIFQPEVRKFLLYLGNTTLKQRSNLFNRFFTEGVAGEVDKQKEARAITEAVLELSKRKLGALIVLSRDIFSDPSLHAGVKIDASIDSDLIESIFQRASPLHDGALLIEKNRIARARCILPVSRRDDLSADLGLRHRAAIGVSENSNAIALVVSEENGAMSYALDGILHTGVSSDEFEQIVKEYL